MLKPRLFFAAAAAAASLAAFQAPASAGGISVKHGDLDLSTASGRATLDARIHDAARDFCRKANPVATGTLLPGSGCRAEVTAQLKARVEAAVAKSSERLAAANGSAPAAP